MVVQKTQGQVFPNDTSYEKTDDSRRHTTQKNYKLFLILKLFAGVSKAIQRQVSCRWYVVKIGRNYLFGKQPEENENFIFLKIRYRGDQKLIQMHIQGMLLL
jgi:hypothetical protein